MKVEFTELNPWGPALIIEYKEYIKGKDESEFESLQHATEAFSFLFGLNYLIIKDEYDFVLDWLKRDGIAFLIIREINPYDRYPELWVSNNNRPQRVMYFENGQKILSKKGNLDFKARKINNNHQR